MLAVAYVSASHASGVSALVSRIFTAAGPFVAAMA